MDPCDERVPSFSGERLKRLRLQLRWSQETLADFLGLPDRQYVGALESERKRIGATLRLCLHTLERVVRSTPPPDRRALQRAPVELHEHWFARVLKGAAAP